MVQVPPSQANPDGDLPLNLRHRISVSGFEPIGEFRSKFGPRARFVTQASPKRVDSGNTALNKRIRYGKI